MPKGEYAYVILNKIDERDYGGICSVQSITDKIYVMKEIFYCDDCMLFFFIWMPSEGSKSIRLLPNVKDLHKEGGTN